MSVRSETDLSQLRIDRDSAPRRRWLPWAALGVVVAAGIAVYPKARALLDERRAPEVEVARTGQVIPASGGGSAHLPVLVACAATLFIFGCGKESSPPSGASPAAATLVASSITIGAALIP